MDSKLIPILLFALVLCAAVFEFAVWSVQTGVPILDILLFRT